MARMMIALILLLLAPVAAFAQDAVVPTDRVASFVKVRSAPSTDSMEVGRLNVGESARLLRSVPRWFEIQLADGTRGFVAKSFTTITQALAPRREDELRIHFLNVGTGSCAIVECPGSGAPTMIVDCGALSAGPNGMSGAEVRAYFQNLVADDATDPLVVLSHADVDHFSHVAEVVGNTPVAQIWQGGDPAEYASDGFPAWLAAQRKGGANVRNRFAKNFHNDGEPVEELSCGEASSFVLTVNTGEAKNAQSLVLMIEYDEFAVTFSGDAAGTTEAQAIANFGGNVKSTVLTASHHGANTEGSNSTTWISDTSPEIVVYSAGTMFRHPTCAAMDRFTSVAETQRHSTRCGVPERYRRRRTTEAHFDTFTNGAVIVTSSGRSPVTVNCSRSQECGVKIAH
jgi:beta-lactamase superfamily II metal-dependent hydrolase